MPSAAIPPAKHYRFAGEIDHIDFLDRVDTLGALGRTASGAIITAGNLRVAPNLRHLYAYLYENQFIHGLREIHEEYLPIQSRNVLERIHAGDCAWEAMVPAQVAQVIRQRRLFGWRPAPAETALAAGGN